MFPHSLVNGGGRTLPGLGTDWRDESACSGGRERGRAHTGGVPEAELDELVVHVDVVYVVLEYGGFTVVPKRVPQ